MNINELRVEFDRLSINPNAYSLEGSSCDECYVLSRKGAGKWEVYYSERGLKSSYMMFNSETEACEEILRRLEKDPTVKI